MSSSVYVHFIAMSSSVYVHFVALCSRTITNYSFLQRAGAGTVADGAMGTPVLLQSPNMPVSPASAQVCSGFARKAVRV